MNITRFNFRQSLPFIEECIAKSSFVAIDLEFTGASKDNYGGAWGLDTVPWANLGPEQVLVLQRCREHLSADSDRNYRVRSESGMHENQDVSIQ